jgi:hypothetical protein
MLNIEYASVALQALAVIFKLHESRTAFMSSTAAAVLR